MYPKVYITVNIVKPTVLNPKGIFVILVKYSNWHNLEKFIFRVLDTHRYLGHAPHGEGTHITK